MFQKRHAHDYGDQVKEVVVASSHDDYLQENLDIIKNTHTKFTCMQANCT